MSTSQLFRADLRGFVDKKNDTNKTILPIDILPCGDRSLAFYKIPFSADFRVPTLGIL